MSNATSNPMDRPIDPVFLKKRKRKRILQISAAAAAVLTLFFLLSAWISPSIQRNEIRTAIVDSGLVEATISASGTVTPLYEEVIPSPAETRVLQVLKRPGEKLLKGEQFLLLDLSAMKLEFDRVSKDHSLKVNGAHQLKLEKDHQIAELESQIHIKRLRLSYLKTKSEQEQKMFEMGGSSKDQLAQTKLEEEIASTEQDNLDLTLSNAKASLANQLEGFSTEISTLAREKADFQRQLDVLSCRATAEGVLTYVAQEIGATIHRGEVIARIANLTDYRVEAVVSDIHSGTLVKGMRAHVSWSGAILDGEISAINPSIENGTVKFFVTLDQKSDPRLRSNLRVDVAVVTSRKGFSLRVAKGPFLTGSTTQNVFVVRDNLGVRTPVSIGVHGFDYVEISSGLNKGDEIIISDMKEYEHVSQVKLK